MAEPPNNEQLLNNGQNARPQLVHYSEVPLYSGSPEPEVLVSHTLPMDQLK